jgi:hypothetical protein
MLFFFFLRILEQIEKFLKRLFHCFVNMLQMTLWLFDFHLKSCIRNQEHLHLLFSYMTSILIITEKLLVSFSLR